MQDGRASSVKEVPPGFPREISVRPDLICGVWRKLACIKARVALVVN